MFGIGYQELGVIFLLVFLLFGGKKIPEIARGIATGLREFKSAARGVYDENEEL